MKVPLFPAVIALSVGLGTVAAQQPAVPAPSSLESPTDDAAAVQQRLNQGSDGKTPTVKKFDPAWIQSLAQRGEPRVYDKDNSKNFAYIGMTVGGIGAGELYLSGDGKLWLWDIFNTRTVDNFQIEQGKSYLDPHTPDHVDAFTDVLQQGFVLQTSSGGKTDTRTIDKDGFSDVKFRGQYPIGYVDFSDPACPVQVGLEAFSPFVPGSVADSSYPATLLNYTFTNTSSQPVDCILGGWLENGVALRARKDTKLQLQNDIVQAAGYTALDCSAIPAADSASSEVYDDFESGTYDNWTVEGTAFGSRPVKPGEIPGHNAPSENQGQYFVDTYVNGRNDAQGTLTSKPFVIKHPYITFLVGGGDYPKDEGLDLVVDGAVVHHAMGRKTVRLHRGFWDVHDLIGKTAQLEIVDHASGGWAFTQVDDIRFADSPRQLNQESDFGTMTLGLLGDSASTEGIADLGAQKPSDAALSGKVATTAQTPETGAKPSLVGALRHKFTLQPGEKVTLNYIVSWYFPNPTGLPVWPKNGRQYGDRFKSSEDVVGHLATAFTRLTSATRLWHQTWYDSTMPYWLLDRTFLNVSTLASSTCFLLNDDRFYANEGGYSCPGTCTHVYSYQQAMGYLFPEIERGLREKVDFNPDVAMRPDGGIRMREDGGDAAVDGQMGIILRTYLAHLMSPDNSFLTKNYDGLKRAMNYLIDSHDANHDGILEGPQPNTLDSAWYGRVAWLSLYYQAALRATAEMADVMNDSDYAKQLRGMADQGRTYIEQKLFNGEYFVEDMDDAKHPESPGSYTGCEIDQLMGQNWAYQLGLGTIIDPSQAAKALDSIWKYNYTSDAGLYRQTYTKGRWFALAGDGGVLMGTFPTGDDAHGLDKGYGSYFNECWAGCEHLLASMMIWQGKVDKGLAVERTIDDRYNVTKRNPWDEVECGSHYGRSMASYSVFTALCGFQYDGPKGELAFDPKLTPDNFKAAFTAAEGWGSYSQKYEGPSLQAFLDLAYGKLRLKSLSLTVPAGHSNAEATVSLDGKAVTVQGRLFGEKLLVAFDPEIDLSAGQKLSIESK